MAKAASKPKLVKVKFLRETNPDVEGAKFKAGEIAEMSEASAARWIRRRAAETVNGKPSQPDAE